MEGSEKDPLRKGHLLRLFATATAIFCPPWLLLFWVYSQVAPFLLVGTCFLVLLWVHRIARSHYNAGCHLLCFAIVTTLFLNSLFTGGGSSPLKQWMGVVPFLSATLLGFRASAFWTSVCLALLVSLSVFPMTKFVPIGAFSLAIEISLVLALFYFAYIAGENVRLRTRERDEAVASRTRFLALIHHELRSPLHGLINTALGLREAARLPRSCSEDLNTILSLSQVLLGQINNVLDWFKTQESGDIAVMSPARMHVLHDVLEPALQVGKMLDQRVRVHLHVEAGTVVEGCSDSQKILQVMLNLISNAVRACGRSGGRSIDIFLSNSTQEDGGLCWFMEVCDDGDGVHPGDEEVIFDMFNQGKKPASQGTGLGLYVCKQISHALGGDIGLNPQRGVRGGARFWFCVPFQNEAVVRESLRSEGVVFARRAVRVLCVEDDLVNRRVLERMLRNMQLEAQICCDGQSAVAVARRCKFSLVLVDLNLTLEMDGFAVCRKLHEIDPDLPVVAMTASGFEESRQEALRAGMAAFLPKPFNLAQLGIVIQENLR